MFAKMSSRRGQVPVVTMAKGGPNTSCASGMTQLDLVSPNRFAVLEDPEQEEAKMPDLDTAEPEEIAQWVTKPRRV